jgi:hypothetical protein
MITSHTKDFEGVKFEIHTAITRSIRVVKAHADRILAMTPVAVIDGAVTATKTDTIGANKGAIALTGSGFDVGAPLGEYDIVCIEPYVVAGTVPAVFEITGPHDFIDTFTAGVAYDGPVNFTKAVGTADAAGDKSKILLAAVASDGKLVPLAPDAVNGSQNPVGICPVGLLANASDEIVAIIADGPTVISDAKLVYGTDDLNKRAAIRAALKKNCNITVIHGEVA